MIQTEMDVPVDKKEPLEKNIRIFVKNFTYPVFMHGFLLWQYNCLWFDKTFHFTHTMIKGMKMYLENTIIFR